MKKDPTEWRKKFDAWKNGTPTSELFNLPKYDDGTGDKTYLPEYEYEATVTPQGTSLEKHKRITNEEDWLKYWGNVGAGYVSLALEAAAPVVLNGMSMLMGNPVGALAGILGSEVGSEFGAKISPLASAIGGLVGGIALDPANLLLMRLISKNIANRNLFAYKYIKPFGYDRPVKRFKEYAKHILTDLDIPNINVQPKYWDPSGSESLLIFRDEAWRKYLGLPERYGIYTPNADGSFSYNLRNIRKIDPNYATKSYAGIVAPTEPTVIADWVTGNGGNVSSSFIDFGYGVGSDAGKRFGMLHLSDKWDLQPFIRKGITEPNIYINALNNANTPTWLNDLLIRTERGLTLKIRNFEVGPVLKGNPFLLETDIPITKQWITVNEMPVSKTVPGFTNDNILPQEYFNYMKYGTPNLPFIKFDNKLNEDLLKNISFQHDKGKSIHINPANKGKFNATKKRTGKTTEQLAHSKNPLTRKRAIFSLNARKWKH